MEYFVYCQGRILVIFLLSIAIMLFRDNYAKYCWLLVIVLELADLIYKHVRRTSHREVQADV